MEEGKQRWGNTLEVNTFENLFSDLLCNKTKSLQLCSHVEEKRNISRQCILQQDIKDHSSLSSKHAHRARTTNTATQHWFQFCALLCMFCSIPQTQDCKSLKSMSIYNTRALHSVCVCTSTWRNCDSPRRLSTAFWQIDGSGVWIPPCSQTAPTIEDKNEKSESRYFNHHRKTITFLPVAFQNWQK